MFFNVFYSLYSHQHVSAAVVAILSDVITNLDPYLYYLLNLTGNYNNL